jgi:2,4-dienoyl-CoA reductase-like NADH-dependent reductase (Old Yellow Enzyme family)
VHRHRVPIFAQINHNGGQASSMFSRLPVWAPSAVADPLFREVPKAVTHAEIEEIVAGYALVAEHCAEGGFDGIELQCSHSSIVRGFLSPATNRAPTTTAARSSTAPACSPRSCRPCAR